MAVTPHDATLVVAPAYVAMPMLGPLLFHWGLLIAIELLITYDIAIITD